MALLERRRAPRAPAGSPDRATPACAPAPRRAPAASSPSGSSGTRPPMAVVGLARRARGAGPRRRSRGAASTSAQLELERCGRARAPPRAVRRRAARSWRSASSGSPPARTASTWPSLALAQLARRPRRGARAGRRRRRRAGRQGARSASSRRRRSAGRRPLLGVARQAALDLGLASAEHAPPLDEAGHRDLEVAGAARPRAAGAPRVAGAPRRPRPPLARRRPRRFELGQARARDARARRSRSRRSASAACARGTASSSAPRHGRSASTLRADAGGRRERRRRVAVGGAARASAARVRRPGRRPGQRGATSAAVRPPRRPRRPRGGLLDGGRGDPAAPARTRQPSARSGRPSRRHHHEVGSGEGEVDRLLPAVAHRPRPPASRRVEQTIDRGDRPRGAATWRRTALGPAGRDRRRAPPTPDAPTCAGQHRARDPARACSVGQGRRAVRRPSDHDGGQRPPRRPPRRPRPSRRRSRPGRRSEPTTPSTPRQALGAGGAACLVERRAPAPRRGPRAGPLLLGARGAPARPTSSRRSARRVAASARPPRSARWRRACSVAATRSLSSAASTSRSRAPTLGGGQPGRRAAASARVPLEGGCEGADRPSATATASSACAARPPSAHGVELRRDLGWPSLRLGGGHLGRRAPGRPPRPRWPELAGQAGRLGLERGDHVDVGRRVEGAATTAPLAQHAGRPRARSTRPCTRPSAVARSSSRWADSSAAVASARRRARSERRGSSALRRGTRPVRPGAVCAPGRGSAARRRPGSAARSAARSASAAWERAAAAWRSSGRIWRRTSRTRSPRRSRFSSVAASRRSARSRRRRCLSTPAASSMMARRSSGRAFEDGVELALADDHVLLAADARVREQLLDVEQPARRAVDGVLAVAGAEQRPGDGDLGQVDRQLAGELSMVSDDLGPAQRRPVGRPGEDDVLHLRRAHASAGPGRRAPRSRRRRRWTCRCRWARPPR